MCVFIHLFPHSLTHITAQYFIDHEDVCEMGVDFFPSDMFENS